MILGSRPSGDKEKWADLVPFPPYQGAAPIKPQFDLNGEEADQATLLDLLLLALRRVFEIIDFGGKSEEDPWELENSVPFYEANSFWKYFREFGQDSYLHQKFWKRHILEWIRVIGDDQYAKIREAQTSAELHFERWVSGICRFRLKPYGHRKAT